MAQRCKIEAPGELDLKGVSGRMADHLVLGADLPGAYCRLYRSTSPVEATTQQAADPAGVGPVRREPGTWSNILGTDKQGRDILSRIMHGSRISLMVSLSALAIGGTIGTTLGLISGYFGRWVDHLIMRVVDTFLALPLILMALVIVAVFGPSFYTAIGVISVLLWSRYTRQIRAEVLSIKQLDFVARARVAGCSNWRIIIKHIFPNVVNTLIVLATLQVGTVILLEATLSFLGAGIPRPNPAWGVMVADGRDHIASAWWIAVMPGLAIMFVVLSMNMMGDWLRDKLDPKLRQV